MTHPYFVARDWAMALILHPLKERPTVTETTTPQDVTTRPFLEISTAHLPPELGMEGLSEVDGVTAYPLTHGWLMWVPDNPDALAQGRREEDVPAVVLAVQRLARQHGCDWVMFDSDADRVDGLPTWDW